MRGQCEYCTCKQINGGLSDDIRYIEWDGMQLPFCTSHTAEEITQVIE
jgi:hypothetical protein